jgi:hypothetical protein
VQCALALHQRAGIRNAAVAARRGSSTFAEDGGAPANASALVYSVVICGHLWINNLPVFHSMIATSDSF